MKQTNGPAGAKDVSALLYRAALAPDPHDRWLHRFQARDAGGARRLAWHSGACLSALCWLALRGLFGLALLWAGVAVLGSVLALGLARLVFGADAQAMTGLLLALVVLGSLAWGLGAERLYHRVTRRRILHAVATQASLAAACTHLQQRQRSRASRWAMLLALGTGLLLALAAVQPLLRPLAPAGMLVETVPAPVAVLPEPVPAPTPEPAPQAEPEPEPVPAPAAIAAPAEPEPEPPAATAAAPPRPPKAGPEAPSTRPKPATEAPRGRYAVQVGVFADGANARAALARLQAAGWTARSEVANAQGHQRVRAGPFTSQAQAQRASERIRALGLPAVVVPVPPARP